MFSAFSSVFNTSYFLLCFPVPGQCSQIWINGTKGMKTMKMISMSMRRFTRFHAVSRGFTNLKHALDFDGFQGSALLLLFPWEFATAFRIQIRIGTTIEMRTARPLWPCASCRSIIASFNHCIIVSIIVNVIGIASFAASGWYPRPCTELYQGSQANGDLCLDCLIRLFRQTTTREDSEQQFLQELRQCNVSKSSQVPLGRRAGMIWSSPPRIVQTVRPWPGE